MTLLEQIQKDNIAAYKAKDQEAKNAYGALISQAKNQIVTLRGEGKEFTDADMYKVINKVLKELDEEYHTYADNGRPEQAALVQQQIAVVKKYEPKLMDEASIRKIIEALPDKSIKAVMAEFKTKYAGQANMGQVNKIAREYQGK